MAFLQFHNLFEGPHRRTTVPERAGRGRKDTQKMQRHANLALPHWHTGAVPKTLLRLHLLVIIVSAGAKRCPKLILVLCQPLTGSSQLDVRLSGTLCTHTDYSPVFCRWLQDGRGHTLMTTAVTDLSIQKYVPVLQHTSVLR
jgi:hypothetical protein